MWRERERERELDVDGAEVERLSSDGFNPGVCVVADGFLPYQAYIVGMCVSLMDFRSAP